MKRLTFYHSMICPRCQMAGWSLSELREEFPDLVVEKVEFLTNQARARSEDVRSIPTLVSGNRRLSGFYLTKERIRGFLQSL